MERSHGRPRRALELVRRELDRDGNPHARPPGMVNTTMSRDENERAERESMRGPAFNAGGGGTVADAMLMHDNYLEWTLDSCPTIPDDPGGGRPVANKPSAAADESPALSRAEAVEAEIAAEAAAKRRRPVPPREQLAMQIAQEVGVRTATVKSTLRQMMADQPKWGRQTRKTMKFLGVTDGEALKRAIAAKFAAEAGSEAGSEVGDLPTV